MTWHLKFHFKYDCNVENSYMPLLQRWFGFSAVRACVIIYILHFFIDVIACAYPTFNVDSINVLIKESYNTFISNSWTRYCHEKNTDPSYIYIYIYMSVCVCVYMRVCRCDMSGSVYLYVHALISRLEPCWDSFMTVSKAVITNMMPFGRVWLFISYNFISIYCLCKPYTQCWFH